MTGFYSFGETVQSPSDVELVTYDRRLAAAAAEAGMTVVAPTESPGCEQ